MFYQGGPTEFARVVAAASSQGLSLNAPLHVTDCLFVCQGVAVVPHGCGVYGYYMAMAFGHINCCEFMMMSEQADSIEPNFGSVFLEEPLPEDGYIALPDTPGFGLELNKEALNLVRPYPRPRE